MYFLYISRFVFLKENGDKTYPRHHVFMEQKEILNLISFTTD
jgi:hypothetical protein